MLTTVNMSKLLKGDRRKLLLHYTNCTQNEFSYYTLDRFDKTAHSGLSKHQQIVLPCVLTKPLPVLEETKIFDTESTTHQAEACRIMSYFNSASLDSDENPAFI